MAEHDLQSVAFPTLDESQIAQLERCAATARKRYKDGEVLFAAGQQDFKFFIVKSGTVDIVDVSGDEPKTVVAHHPGQSTGDMSHLNGARAVVTAVAHAAPKSKTEAFCRDLLTEGRSVWTFDTPSAASIQRLWTRSLPSAPAIIEAIRSKDGMA